MLDVDLLEVVGYAWQTCPPGFSLDDRRSTLLMNAIDWLLCGAKV